MRRVALFLPLLIVTGLLVALPAAAADRTYPMHTRIVATTAWVGEVFDANAADGSQVCSTYDDQWAKRWSGKDNGARASAGTDCAGAPLGGCDGRPSGSGVNFKCATERRTAANGFWPTDPSVTPLENPFYLNLPFDDVNNSQAFQARGAVVPWANDPGYAGQAKNRSFSLMKNRWVQLTRGGNVCYAQIEDAGPGRYNDQAYVFGAADARPQSRQYGNAGMDVSPAVTGCLNLPSVDGISPADISWRFVEAGSVPAGPWTRLVTTSQVNGAVGSAEYIASVTPGGAVPTTTATPTTTVTTTTSDSTTPTSSTSTSSTSTTTLPSSGSVKALDSANTITDPAWFVQRKAEGVELYVMHSTSWGTCSPWSRTQAQLKMALDAGMKIAVYTRDPRCWAGGIDAAGPYVSQLQFFALDVETDPGVPVTREMVDGVVAKGVRPVVYSGSGMWPGVMGAGNSSFADVPLWDTDARSVSYASWVPNVNSPAPVAYGGWNTAGNPRAIIQQAFEVSVGGVRVDLNSVRADFLVDKTGS